MATVGTYQLVLGQFVNDFNKRKIDGQRLVFDHRLVGAMTSSSTVATDSATLSASFNKAICWVAGLNVCSD